MEAAHDRLSSASSHGSGATTLVTYNTTSGVLRPVLSGEETLLSLGRAVIADPTFVEWVADDGGDGHVQKR